MKPHLMSNEQIQEVLTKCYDAALKGLPGLPSASEMAQEYLKKNGTPDKAAKRLINNQIVKCTTSGFLTNIGGLITLPVALPVNIVSVLYIQLRMIAAIADLGGYDINSDEVQTLAYTCLAGTSIADILKNAGVKIANKTTTNLVKKIPGALLIKINKLVGFRLITKFGTTGVVNIGKVVPIVGGVVGAGVDYTGTKLIARRAYRLFIKNRID